MSDNFSLKTKEVVDSTPERIKIHSRIISTTSLPYEKILLQRQTVCQGIINRAITLLRNQIPE